MTRRCILSRLHTALLVCAVAVLVIGGATFVAVAEDDAPARQNKENAKPADADLAARPITTAKGELGGLLRKWRTEGTAAGNVGDWYDNRDRGHSNLRTEPYPQLSRVAYSEEELKRRADWAAARGVREHVTFGNSSTSASVANGGSNPRHYYSDPRGLELLYQQYTHNNLYIYPEHRDHDPGHNGVNNGDGYGDLYPANTPYLIISQGSSGTDQPFMRAMPQVLAAFRPEVKRKLVETGLLMPAVQMIFRSTNKQLADPRDYLTGKAHPTVFEGQWIDPLAMCRLAHEIPLDAIPPLAKLRVVEEPEQVSGRDYFDPSNEKFADTPCAIVRMFRGKNRWRELTLSAENSLDVNERPLAFTWVLLRGDEKRVRIEPQGDHGKRAKIAVAWHPRRPALPGGIESNRVDIGVFAHNGAYYSPPAFFSFFFFDSEGRTYDEAGRVVEIGYGLGESVVDVKDWPKLMRLAASDSPAAKLLPLSDAERAALSDAAPRYEELDQSVKQAREKQQSAEGEQKQAAQKELQEAEAKLREVVTGRRDDLGASLDAVVQRAVERLLDDPQLVAEDLAVIEKTAGEPKTRAVLDAERKRLAALGFVRENDDSSAFDFTRLREANDSDGPPPWTDFERAMIRRTNLRVLTELLYAGALSGRFVPNYVDPRLTVPKDWRDVYHYTADGHLLGWTRYAPDGKSEFNPHGELVLSRDEAGRCIRSRTVDYGVKLVSRTPIRFAPLAQSPGEDVLTYKYAGGDDYIGRVVDREKFMQDEN